jgi:hypothetical protein
MILNKLNMFKEKTGINSISCIDVKIIYLGLPPSFPAFSRRGGRSTMIEVLHSLLRPGWLIGFSCIKNQNPLTAENR